MSKPEDIPQDVWDIALACAETVLRNLPDDYGDVSFEIATIARAILSAEKRGEEREREGALSDLQAVLDDLPSHDPGVCLDMGIRAIRARSSDVNTTHKISGEQ